MDSGGDDVVGGGRDRSAEHERREPVIGSGGASEIRISPDERRGPVRRRKGERIEPAVGIPVGGDLRATRQEPTGTGSADMGPADMGRHSRSGRQARLRREDAAPAAHPLQRGKAAARGRRQRPRRSLLGRLFRWTLILGVWGLIGVGAVAAYFVTQLPPIDQLAVPKRPPNIAIMASDGSLIANRGDTGGAAVPLKELPPYLPKAFVAIEDRRFYSHLGIDPMGIVRAVVRNLSRHAGMEGGSTLTQQLAKNLFLTQERTVARKIQEAILAVWLEHKFSKDQILELYLNRVYFGSGAYGVEAASRKYFNKGARQVSLAEAALLAGLMKAPTKLSPTHNLAGANERAAQVIGAMKEEKFITDGMAMAALARPAELAHLKGEGSANYAADYVMDQLNDTVGAIDQDIVVRTSIDPRLQGAAERALDDELNAKGRKFGVSQGAMVALDMDGGIRAMVGGRNYSESQFNRVTAAKRQPGSSFKPFVYLTALENGLTPDSVREDAPIDIKGWQPENSSRDFRGPVTLTQALAFSINTVAVRLCLEVGPRAVVKTAHRLGIQSELQPNASIALGTSVVTPLEMVSAYTTIANGGIGVQPHAIESVKTGAGRLLYQRKGSAFGRIIDPQYVAMLDTMMQETLLTGTARKAELPGWQAAGKTGTSQDYRDAWFIGFTSQLAAGVWLGNDDNSPTRKASGANLPVEVWSRFMRAAHKGVPASGLTGGLWNDPVPSDAPVASSDAFDPRSGNPPSEDGQPTGTVAVPASEAARRPVQPANEFERTGAPLDIDPQAQEMRPPLPPAAARGPIPPAPIPEGEVDERGRRREEPSFFERMFGN